MGRKAALMDAVETEKNLSLMIIKDRFFWRRWRDSNSRGAFDPYTISNRARSTNYATSPELSARLAPDYYTTQIAKKQYVALKNFANFSA